MISRVKQYFRSGHVAMAPTLSMSDFLATESHTVAYPLKLDNVHCLHTYNGSAAIYQAAEAMQLQAGDVVLLPAYCCGAELGPFEHIGCKPVFYDVQEDLSVNFDNIEVILTTQPEVRLLLITHYLGLPQRCTPQLVQLCLDQNVVLVEDCAHALYGELDGTPLGSFGDYAIFSPRKTLPLTEGGLLVTRQAFAPVVQQSMSAPRLVPRLDRLTYSLIQGLRSQSSTGLPNVMSRIGIALLAIPSIGVKLLKASRLLPEHAWLTPDVERAEAVPVYFQSSSQLSRQILRSSHAREIVASRRNNHGVWLECIQECPNVKAKLSSLPDGCCPLYFVVEVSDPAACVEALRQCDIEAFNWWQHKSDLVDWQSYPVASRLKQSLLALPVHQKLTPDQIKYMAGHLMRIVA